MTEEVTAPADLAVFKDTAATCGQNNVDADSEVYNNLIAISAQTEGWNKDHLVLAFNDWREIDDSDHWQDDTENALVILIQLLTQLAMALPSQTWCRSSESPIQVVLLPQPVTPRCPPSRCYTATGYFNGQQFRQQHRDRFRSVC